MNVFDGGGVCGRSKTTPTSSLNTCVNNTMSVTGTSNTCRSHGSTNKCRSHAFSNRVGVKEYVDVPRVRPPQNKRTVFPLFLLLLLLSIAGTDAVFEGTYSVIAPSILRPNRDFSVVVSSHNTNDSLRIALEITGNLGGDGANAPNTFQTRQEAELQPDSTQLVKFQMGDLSQGDYHLSVSGSTATRPGVQFRNITALKFEPKSYSVFVETDKAVYKPGDLVRFRVIVVSPNLRPSVTGAIDVHVEDGGGVTVRRFDRVFTNKGVFTDTIQLSTEPVLGHWTIVVTVLGQENRGSFYVAEFVPPKFEVKVGVPEHLSLEDKTVTVTVDANYPYGRPIAGEVTVQVTPRYKYKYLQAPYDRPVSVVRSMKGSTEIVLDMIDDLGLRGDYARVLEVTAYVKEALTERVQNSSVAVTVFRFPYRMNFIRSSATFKPGLKYTAYLQLSYQDGRPVTSGEVTVRHAFVRDESAFIETRHQVPPTGIVTLSMFPPLERPGPSWTLALEATYGALTQWLGEVPRAHSPAGAFLQATLLTERPTVGDEVLVALNSTEHMIYFVYEVMARGQILYATTLQAHQGTTHTFRFLASSAMYPRARLVVYYVRPDGEVVADSLHFSVARDVQNKVSLSVTPKDVDVSSSGRVAITVSAKPNSIIGVTSMDARNSAILSDRHRLGDSDIMSELESYDPGLPWGSGGPRVGDNQGLLRRARNKRSLGEFSDGRDFGLHDEEFRRNLVSDMSTMHSRQKRSNEEHEERFERTPKEKKDEAKSDPGQRTTRHKRSTVGSENRFGSFSADPAEHSSNREKRATRAEIAWYGTAAAHDVFQDAGVVVMTNANIPQDNPLTSGAFLTGEGPIDGRGWDPSDLPPAHNGPFGRLAEAYRPDTYTLRPDLGPGLEYNAPPRPALAGPYAFSYIPPPPDHKPRVYLSQHPPPTWLFTHRRTGLNGIITWQEEVPKSPLTSYTLTAFAIDDFEGLTMADSMSEVVSQRPFYVSVRVPPSVIRGEAVAVEMVVFNYGRSNLTATVTLHNEEGAFLFPDFSNEIEQASPASDKSRQISVPSDGGRTALSFMIVPHKLGVTKIKVTAEGGGIVDVSMTDLTVKPEGHRLTVTKSLFFDPAAPETFSRTLNISLPRNIVEDSLSIEVSALGDVLGGAVASLQPLTTLPRGCGEQNMAAVVHTLITLDHLKSLGSSSRTLEERAIADLQLRLQQQLTYRQPDGSFAYFDEYRPTFSSTWLTAFVAKSLRSLSRYVDVPRYVITDALAWMVRQQQADGSFAEPEPPTNLRQNGAQDLDVFGVYNGTGTVGFRGTPLALTAYVFLAIMEVEDYTSVAVRNAGNRALEYLSLSLQQEPEDSYGLAITTYALHVADHPYRDTAFYMLEALATVEDDEKFWPSGEMTVSTEEGNIVSSLSIEQTSYALLTYSRRSLAVDSTPVVRWLTRHRNALGGFTSSQDTAVGLSALSALHSLLKEQSAPSLTGDSVIKVVYGERGHRFGVSSANARNLQKLELPASTRSIELSGSGTHVAVVQLSYSYNVRVTAPRPAFSLDPQLDRSTDAHKLRLTACTGLLGRASANLTRSNMAVMQVALPSGYVIDHDAIPGLYDYPGVRRVEPLHHEDDGTDVTGEIQSGVAIYFDSITVREVCPTIVASRVDRVAFQKPTVVKVYDYYDLTRQARQFYDAAPATLCDICDIGECDPDACDVQIAQLDRQRQDPEDIGFAATVVETSSAGDFTVAPALLLLVLALLGRV